MRQFYFAVMMSAALVAPVKAWSQAAVSAAAGARISPHQAALERAYRLKDQKRVVPALAAFKAILQKEPRNYAALSEAGYLHASLKQYNSAVKYMTAASALDPENMRLRMDLGYALQAVKQYGPANDQFQIVAAKPGEFQAAAREAATEVQRFLADAGQVEAKRRQLMERGYAASNKGNLEEAASYFEAVRALLPNDHLVALQLGYTYDRLKRKDQARAAFSAALGSADAKVRDAAQAALQASGVEAASSIQ